MCESMTIIYSFSFVFNSEFINRIIRNTDMWIVFFLFFLKFSYSVAALAISAIVIFSGRIASLLFLFSLIW